jgi:hypothetical protein
MGCCTPKKIRDTIERGRSRGLMAMQIESFSSSASLATSVGWLVSVRERYSMASGYDIRLAGSSVIISKDRAM